MFRGVAAPEQRYRDSRLRSFGRSSVAGTARGILQASTAPVRPMLGVELAGTVVPHGLGGRLCAVDSPVSTGAGSGLFHRTVSPGHGSDLTIVPSAGFPEVAWRNGMLSQTRSWSARVKVAPHLPPTFPPGSGLRRDRPPATRSRTRREVGKQDDSGRAEVNSQVAASARRRHRRASSRNQQQKHDTRRPTTHAGDRKWRHSPSGLFSVKLLICAVCQKEFLPRHKRGRPPLYCEDCGPKIRKMLGRRAARRYRQRLPN